MSTKICKKSITIVSRYIFNLFQYLCGPFLRTTIWGLVTPSRQWRRKMFFDGVAPYTELNF